MKLHIPTPCFLKTLQVQSPVECQQATVRSACLGIFKPTQALNLFASIQLNAPHWVRELQNWCGDSFRDMREISMFYSWHYNSISFTLLKFNNTSNDNKMWKEFMFALKYFASYEDPDMGSLLKFSPCQGFHLYPPSISSIIEMSHPVAPQDNF